MCVVFFFFQKPVNELGKAYVDFMRGNLDQMRNKINDELYTLSLFEVRFNTLCVLSVNLIELNDQTTDSVPSRLAKQHLLRG